MTAALRRDIRPNLVGVELLFARVPVFAADVAAVREQHGDFAVKRAVEAADIVDDRGVPVARRGEARPDFKHGIVFVLRDIDGDGKAAVLVDAGVHMLHHMFADTHIPALRVEILRQAGNAPLPDAEADGKRGRAVYTLCLGADKLHISVADCIFHMHSPNKIISSPNLG